MQREKIVPGTLFCRDVTVRDEVTSTTSGRWQPVSRSSGVWRWVLRPSSGGRLAALSDGPRTSFASGQSRHLQAKDQIAVMVRRAHDHNAGVNPRVRVRTSHSSARRLTRREQEVLHLVRQGLTNEQIARSLWVSLSTVKVHMRHIFEKLGVRSRTQAAVWREDS